MQDDSLDAIAAVLPPLLKTLDALLFLARHLNPPDFVEILKGLGAPEVALKAARPRLQELPDALPGARARLEAASDAALDAFDGLRAAVQQGADLRAVMRALRQGTLAQEALYPLAAASPAVSQFFLSTSARNEPEVQARAGASPAVAGQTGLIQSGAAASQRGGFALYVPEYYTPDRAWPLVMALHGGSGNGRLFLWSWIRDARSRGAILVAPTAIGSTWALMGEDADTPNLSQILQHVRARWNVDAGRMLLSGMSDGGTFCYVSGLTRASPFTHLAPVAAAFHPLLAQMADATRTLDLPVFVTHGALDWMFPVEIARLAHKSLTKSGARVTYREIEDLSHCYPPEINDNILRWLDTAPGQGAERAD